MSAVDVSVIVPAYNVGAYLRSALERLREQAFDSYEIIVVDDASVDATEEIGRGASASDDRLVYIRQEANAGVAAARERGVAAARGEFVWFVDADDDWEADAIALMVEAARATGAEVVCAGARYLLEGGGTKPVGEAGAPRTLDGKQAFRLLLDGRITGHLWNKLFRRTGLERIEFTRARQHSDQAMVAQLLANAGTVAVIDDIVYGYRLRGGSIIRSGSKRAESLKTVAAVIADCAARVDPELPSSAEFRYYTARFNLLSRMKDATSGAYSDAEAQTLVREVRAEISSGVLLTLLLRTDVKRFVMLAAAKASVPLYRTIMSRDGARA